MSALTLYGLKSCDTCKKARKALDAGGGASVAFVDLRADADVAALVPGWLAAVGAKVLVNRASTTWRGLSQADKDAAEADPAAALIAHPTLIKRPVIVTQEGAVHVGWKADTQAALGV